LISDEPAVAFGSFEETGWAPPVLELVGDWLQALTKITAKQSGIHHFTNIFFMRLPLNQTIPE
jgi:hypothetical protein